MAWQQLRAVDSWQQTHWAGSSQISCKSPLKQILWLKMQVFWNRVDLYMHRYNSGIPRIKYFGTWWYVGRLPTGLPYFFLLIHCHYFMETTAWRCLYGDVCRKMTDEALMELLGGGDIFDGFNYPLTTQAATCPMPMRCRGISEGLTSIQDSV